MPDVSEGSYTLPLIVSLNQGDNAIVIETGDALRIVNANAKMINIQRTVVLVSPVAWHLSCQQPGLRHYSEGTIYR